MYILSKPLILASGSPRRKEILSQAGFNFKVEVKNIEEKYPSTLSAEEVPIYLAKLKAQCFEAESTENIILTSDTVVIHRGEILGKPRDEQEAFDMIKRLSGSVHEVVSGVCIFHNTRYDTFSDVCKVYFNELSDDEIRYYINQYQPLDKAGAYGIQEWIGMAAISKIEGSFYTVMGLPIHQIYNQLKRFAVK